MFDFLKGGYQVCGCQVVLCNGNIKPFHQDRLTGMDAFERDMTLRESTPFDVKNVMNGARILIDLGTARPTSECSNRRSMSFCLNDGDISNLKLIKSFDQRVVIMNYGAAGSGCFNNVFHGRVDSGQGNSNNGITTSVDIILPRRDTIKMNLQFTLKEKDIFQFYF